MVKTILIILFLGLLIITLYNILSNIVKFNIIIHYLLDISYLLFLYSYLLGISLVAWLLSYYIDVQNLL